MTLRMTPHEKQAYDLGVEAALAAASWVLDGNTPQEHIARMVAWLDEGDPIAYDHLPETPNLSGEWAGDPTPASLAYDILGDDRDDDAAEELANAWDLGVEDTFLPECERLLRAALAD